MKEHVKDLEAQAIAHNQSVDDFINITLRDHFNGDMINLQQWFEAQRLIKEQDFWGKGLVIVKALQKSGIDCKINAQTNKLYCPSLKLYDV